MRISKILPWSSDYRIWLLGLGVCLVVLGGWSQQQNEANRYAGKIIEQSIQRWRTPSKRPGDPPVLAYWIFGSKGDSKKVLRLLKAVYHPRNQYLLHLDAAAPDDERLELATGVQSKRVFRAFGNVNVVGKSYAVNVMGVSSLAAMLHASALLLKLNTDWDWFTALSTFDYPLLSQDDILYAFTVVPRELNFVQFANDTDWKEEQRINRIVLDTNLYLRDNGPVYHAVETRETPNAFKIYGGSPWMILSRGLIEHCVMGWDNLPRKLLMYFTNSVDPLESYFHTVLCNSPEFENTTVNHDLRYINRNNGIGNRGTGGGMLLELNKSYYDELISKGAIFARPFQEDDSTLEKIDKNILDRQLNRLEVGKWCLDHGISNHSSITATSHDDQQDFCSSWDDIDTVIPGSHGERFREFLSQLSAQRRSVSNRCSRG